MTVTQSTELRTFEEKKDSLLSDLKNRDSLLIALSGGVDSSLLAVAAKKSGATFVLAVTSDSASLATGERERCEQFCSTWGIALEVVQSEEFNNEQYLVNNPDRCYWCKSALMDELEPFAKEHNAEILLGVNVDDLGDHRPGQHAADERGAIFPLVTAGFTKTDIRTLAHEWGLEVWDRPAMPCLSSRIPYGTTVTVPLLSKIDRAEQALRAQGLMDVRVRHYNNTARIEVPKNQLAQTIEQSENIVTSLQAIGYEYVTLDLAGLRSGNLNNSHLSKKETQTSK